MQSPKTFHSSGVIASRVATSKYYYRYSVINIKTQL